MMKKKLNISISFAAVIWFRIFTEIPRRSKNVIVIQQLFEIVYSIIDGVCLLGIYLIWFFFRLSLISIPPYFQVQTIICNNESLNHLIMHEYHQKNNDVFYFVKFTCELKITEPNVAIEVRWSLTIYYRTIFLYRNGIKWCFIQFCLVDYNRTDNQKSFYQQFKCMKIDFRISKHIILLCNSLCILFTRWWLIRKDTMEFKENVHLNIEKNHIYAHNNWDFRTTKKL